MNYSLSRLLLASLLAALVASGCASARGTASNAAPGTAAAPAGGAAPSLLGIGAKPGTANTGGASPANLLASAQLCERRRQNDEAERLYLEVIRQSPDNPVPHHRLAVLYTKRGRFKEADEHFSRALALKPDDPRLLNDVGYFYHLASRPKEAERCLRRAVEIEPANRAFSNNLALVLADQGRRDECFEVFRRAGSEKEARANYAFVLAQQGEYKQALDLYDRVLTEDQSMRAAADAMIELSQLVPPKKPARSTPPADDPPAIAADQRDPDREAPQPGLATGTPCVYTVPATASAPSEPSPTPQVDPIVKEHQGVSTASPLSPPPVASPRELPVSAATSRWPVPPTVAATADGSAAPSQETASRPALGLSAQRVALLAVAGAIFLGIAAVARFRRRPPATQARSGLGVAESRTGGMRPKVAMAAVPSPRTVSIHVRRPRYRHGQRGTASGRPQRAFPTV